MINVIIELWPHGDQSRKEVIDGLQIANDGTGDTKVGNYLFRWNDQLPWKPSVQKYNRYNSPAYLVYLALKNEYENKDRKDI